MARPFLFDITQSVHLGDPPPEELLPVSVRLSLSISHHEGPPNTHSVSLPPLHIAKLLPTIDTNLLGVENLVGSGNHLLTSFEERRLQLYLGDLEDQLRQIEILIRRYDATEEEEMIDTLLHLHDNILFAIDTFSLRRPTEREDHSEEKREKRDRFSAREREKESESHTKCVLLSDNCPICWGTGLYGYVTPQCQHVACVQCWYDYVMAKVSEGDVIVIRCPNPSCDTELDEDFIELILDQKSFAKYQQFLFLSRLRRNSNVRYCPHPHCSAPVLPDPLESVPSRMTCPECHTQFCFDCNEIWHPNVTCDEAKRLSESKGKGKDLSEERRRREEEKMMRKYLTDHKTIACPRCGSYVQKMSGCNHMRCPCGHEFCWICGDAIIGGGIYPLHFRVGPCAGLQMEDVDQLNWTRAAARAAMAPIKYGVIGVAAIVGGALALGIAAPAAAIALPILGVYEVKKRKKKREKDLEKIGKSQDDEAAQRERDAILLDEIVSKILFPNDPFSMYSESSFPELHIALLYSIASLFSIGKFVRFKLSEEKSILSPVVERDGVYVALHRNDSSSQNAKFFVRIDSSDISPVYERAATRKFLHFVFPEKTEKKKVKKREKEKEKSEENSPSPTCPVATNENLEVTTLYVPRRRTKTASRASDIGLEISLIDAFKGKEEDGREIKGMRETNVSAAKEESLILDGGEREKESGKKKEEKPRKRKDEMALTTTFLAPPKTGVIRSVSLTNEGDAFNNERLQRDELRLPLLGIESEWANEIKQSESDGVEIKEKESKKKKKKKKSEKEASKDIEIRIIRSKTECGEEAVPTDAFVLMRYSLPSLSEREYKHFKAFEKMKRNRMTLTLKQRATMFQINQRLEAQDFRSPSYICVASISDKRDIFLKIHYDFESDHFDYWCRVDSPHIFPIGTCDLCGRDLSVPYQMNWKNWSSYLQEMKVEAVPRDAFANDFVFDCDLRPFVGMEQEFFERNYLVLRSRLAQ